MLNQVAFEKCIRTNLKDRRFGKKRADEIIEEYKARAQAYRQDGKSEVDASLLAMNDTFENMSKLATEKAKRTAKMLAVQASAMQRIEQGLTVNTSLTDTKGGKKGSRGKAMGYAAMSLIEHDPRFTGLSYNGQKEIIRGQLFAVMADVVDKAGKGAFGRQKGKAHLPNIAREVLGEDTGDLAAKELAKGWLKSNELGVDLFNEAGGSMGKLRNYLPSPDQNGVKLSLNREKWISTRMDRWDWDRMRWPDGTRIEVKDRPGVIEAVYDTKALDGANKIDPTKFRGQGRALGNAIERHRFVHYKNADAWLADLNEFGDGTVFDVMVRHTEDMAHRIAMIETFGPNPELSFNNIEAIVKSQAAKLGDKEVKAADAILKNKFRPALEIISRSNPMDPESLAGNIGTGLSNILTSAQLGAASLLAIPGDTMQTIMTRAANNQPLWGGVDYYFKTLATDRKFMNDISVQSGFIIDELVTSTYSTQRYTGVNTVGPAISRRISDSVMRLSVMSGHTVAARGAVQKEFMGMLWRDRGKAFKDLPYNRMMARYGITPEDWDVMRSMKAYSPKKGINFLRPLDVLDTDNPAKSQLFRKFQGMIVEEARTGVPESTISAAVTLKGADRPDTLRGLIMHSFAMYKNFPVSFFTIYGRLGMTSPSVKGRLSFYAGLGAGMTMVGALGVQMREVSKGRDPLPMDKPAFWGKAFMAGGAMSIWGDFLFAGTTMYGQGPEDIIGGPLAGLAGDTTKLAFGPGLKTLQDGGSFSEALEAYIDETPADLVQFAKRYTPGTSIWWSRLALERQVWDRLEELADPKAYRKMQRRMRSQEEKFGNEYWWPMGETSPERPPQYEGTR